LLWRPRENASTIGGKSVPGLAKKKIDAVLGECAQKDFPGDRFALDASLHVRPCGSL
jgi:hypothetical protein